MCGGASGLEALCATHKRVLATSASLTPEQVRVRRPGIAASLAVVDVFGVVHPLPDDALVGRDPQTCDLALLHASVSSRHARVVTSADAIEIIDQDSLNGTFVDHARVRRVALPFAVAHLRFGDVSLMLCPDALAAPSPQAGVRRTVPSPERLAQLDLNIRGNAWRLTVAGDGAGLDGPGGALQLSSMEGRLLRVLLSRAGDEAFVPSGELVLALGFGTRAADGDNVRELVRRLRKKLADVGLDGLIESRRNSGYRAAPWAEPG